MLLFIWLDWNSNMYYEHLRKSSKFDWLEVGINEKRPGLASRKSVVFYQDRNTLHLITQNRMKLAQPTDQISHNDAKFWKKGIINRSNM